MSRLMGLGFVLCDAAATCATVIYSSGAVVVLVTAFFTSCAVGLLSSTVRSLLWPTYFWDTSANE